VIAISQQLVGGFTIREPCGQGLLHLGNASLHAILRTAHAINAIILNEILGTEVMLVSQGYGLRLLGKSAQSQPGHRNHRAQEGTHLHSSPFSSLVNNRPTSRTVPLRGLCMSANLFWSIKPAVELVRNGPLCLSARIRNDGQVFDAARYARSHAKSFG